MEKIKKAKKHHKKHKKHRSSIPLRDVAAKPPSSAKDAPGKEHKVKSPLSLLGAGSGSGGNLSHDEKIVVVLCMVCCVFTIVMLVFFGGWIFTLLAVLQLFCYILIILGVLVHERLVLLIGVLFLMVLTLAIIILFIVGIAFIAAQSESDHFDSRFETSWTVVLVIDIVLLLLICLYNGSLIYFAWKLSGGLR